MNRSVFLAYGAVITAVLIWGISFVATKIALATIPLYLLIFIRFSISLSLFLLYQAFRRRWPSFTLREHGRILLMSLFEPGLYFIFETAGLKMTSAGEASLIIATVPIAILLLSALLYREKIGLIKKLGTAVSIGGIALLVFGASHGIDSGKGSLVGDLLIVGAVVSAAFYTLLLRDLARKFSPVDLTLMQIIYGTIFFSPFAIAGWGTFDVSAVSSASWIALVYLAILSTLVAFLCYNYGLRTISPIQASLFANCIPIITIAVSSFMIREILTPLQLIGGVLVLGAVFLSNDFSSRSSNSGDIIVPEC
ncbi:MAG: DMT family transporter [Chitinivibrionales bacterium]|nr:DMT family transporter [Chitinivibrionales bacterium]